MGLLPEGTFSHDITYKLISYYMKSNMLFTWQKELQCARNPYDGRAGGGAINVYHIASLCRPGPRSNIILAQI